MIGQQMTLSYPFITRSYFHRTSSSVDNSFSYWLANTSFFSSSLIFLMTRCLEKCGCSRQLLGLSLKYLLIPTTPSSKSPNNNWLSSFNWSRVCVARLKLLGSSGFCLNIQMASNCFLTDSCWCRSQSQSRQKQEGTLAGQVRMQKMSKGPLKGKMLMRMIGFNLFKSCTIFLLMTSCSGVKAFLSALSTIMSLKYCSRSFLNEKNPSLAICLACLVYISARWTAVLPWARYISSKAFLLMQLQRLGSVLVINERMEEASIALL